jgi:hypothetical protein
MVETKYPGDHTMFSFQYTFPNHSNFFLSLLALCALIRPITSLTEYFGGMIMIVWIWSTWIFCSNISTPGIPFRIFGHNLFRYSLMPEFRIRLRYFGIHTTWYSVLYTECPDNRFSTVHQYTKISPGLIHPRVNPWNSDMVLERTAYHPVSALTGLKMRGW